MAGLKEQFLRFYAPGDDETSDALHAGLVAVDTNVLLSLYRFQSQARDELLRVFEQLGDRLWVPHQVALEFHENRLTVIAEQERFFGKVQADLQASADDYIRKFKTFCNRIVMPEATVRKVVQKVQTAHLSARSEVSEAEKGNQVHLDNRDSDEILAQLEILLNDKVGDPMRGAQLDEARKEGRQRIEAKIPPGYMDRGKADPFGDYIIWKQLKEEATKRRMPTVFVTDDRKEDWFRREHGLTLGPRTQLCEEMEAEAGVRLLIMTTETFLVQAKKHLGASVSSATVDQAKAEARQEQELRRVSAELKNRAHQLQAKSAQTMELLAETLGRRAQVASELDELAQGSGSPEQINSLTAEVEVLVRRAAVLRDKSERYNLEYAEIRHQLNTFGIDF